MNVFGLQPHLFPPLLIAAVSVILVLIWQRKGWKIPYTLTWVPYLITIIPFILLSELPAGDSHTYFYPTFEHILRAVREGNLFPQWLPASGGVRTGVYHILCIPTIPHKILGYYLLSYLPFTSVVIYKLSYIAGVLLMGYGWWLVLNYLTNCRLASYFGTIMIIMGGTGITFHQEHVLGNIYLIPWFVLAVLKLKDESRYIFPLVILFGLGVTTYEPQIQVISMGLFVLVSAFFSPATVKNIFLERKRGVLILLLLFILSLLPAVYFIQQFPNLACDHRTVITGTYPDFLKMNLTAQTSAIGTYFLQYLRPTVQAAEIAGYGEMADRCSFFIGRMGLILALIGIIFTPRRALPIIILLIFFTALTLGINCPVPIPRILFMLGFPAINTFREWLHFFVMVNYCLSALAALGFAAVVKGRERNAGIVFTGLISVILFIQIADLSLYDRRYISEFKEQAGPNLESQFSSEKNYAGARVFQYTYRNNLYHACPEAIPSEPYLTTNTVTVTGGRNRELEAICSIASGGGNLTVIDTLIDGRFQPEIQIARLTCPATVNSRGLTARVTSPAPALLVTPLNYDLGARAFLDDEEAPLVRVNGALSGVLVPEGDHRVNFIIPWDIYWPLVWIQWILYLFIALFFLRKNKIKKIPKK